MGKTIRFNSIQFLRGLAVGLVVYCHSIDMQMHFSVSRQQNFFFLQNFGAIGVDLFFAISGFVITLVAYRYTGIPEGLRYLSNRFVRINPLYYLASLISLVGMYGLVAFNQPVSSANSTIGKSIMQSITVLPVFRDPVLLPVLGVGWTLSFEWLFYLFFFFTILSGTRHKIVMLLSIILALVAAGCFLHPVTNPLVFITNPIMLEFVLGVIICQLYLTGKKIPVSIAYGLLAAGIAGYLALILFGYGDVSEYNVVLDGTLSMKRFLLWGIPSGLLVAGCMFLEQKNVFMGFWENRWLLLASNASFSIYLTHAVVLSMSKRVYGKFGFFMAPDIAIIVQWLVAMFAGILFYQWIEVPLLRLLRKKRNKG